MLNILLMLNNYFHDFATALFVVTTLGMLFIVRYVEKRGGRDLEEMVLVIYPKMVHLAGGSVIFLFFAGVVRAFTFNDFEWNSAVEHGQVAALMVKHVLLLALFTYGVYLWITVYRRVKELRKKHI